MHNLWMARNLRRGARTVPDTQTPCQTSNARAFSVKLYARASSGTGFALARFLLPRKLRAIHRLCTGSPQVIHRLQTATTPQYQVRRFHVEHRQTDTTTDDSDDRKDIVAQVLRMRLVPTHPPSEAASGANVMPQTSAYAQTDIRNFLSCGKSHRMVA